MFSIKDLLRIGWLICGPLSAGTAVNASSGGKDGGFLFPGRADITPEHPGGVKGHGEVSPGVKGDEASGASHGGQFFQGPGRGILQGFVFVFHQGGHLTGDIPPDEKFAVAGAGDRTGGVVGPGSCPDQGVSPILP